MKTRPTSELVKLIVRGATSEDEQADVERELNIRMPARHLSDHDPCTCLACLGYPTRNP